MILGWCLAALGSHSIPCLLLSLRYHFHSVLFLPLFTTDSPNFASYSFPLPLSPFHFPCFLSFAGKYPLPGRCLQLIGTRCHVETTAHSDLASLGWLGASAGVNEDTSWRATRVWRSDNITLPSLHHLFGSLFYYSYIQTDDPGNFNMSGIYQVSWLSLNKHFSWLTTETERKKIPQDSCVKLVQCASHVQSMAEAYPTCLRARGGVHSGQVASLSKGSFYSFQ